MKILTRKKQDDVLKRLVAIDIIFRDILTRVPLDEELADAWEKYVDNAFEIAYLVGGFEGMSKVHNTIQRFLTENENKC